MDIPAEHQTIATHLAAVFSGLPQVINFSDEAGKHDVAVLRAKNSPVKDIDSYSTIGLSDLEQTFEGLDKPIRVELVGACGSDVTKFDNLLSTAAFCVLNHGWPCHPGAIFADLVTLYQLSETLEHLFLVDPYLWDGLDELTLPDREVLWLMAVPISEAEAAFAEENGSDALEDLFEKNQIDVFDLNRPSVV